MSHDDQRIPFKLTTYKLNFHAVNSSREGLKRRILGDALTDVWCLQGVNLSKQLKDLPHHEAYCSAGMALVHNTERVKIIGKDTANLIQHLLMAMKERQSVADALPVSFVHLTKLKIFIGVAAYEMLPPSASSTRCAALPRLLVVNVDFEKYRTWGASFQSSLLCVLCRLIWDDKLGFSRRWDCRHVCLAGSFFFAPGSAPYQLLTSLSGGLEENIVARLIVPPFTSIDLDEVDSGVATSATKRTCVVAAELAGNSRGRQLLGLQVRSGSANGPVVTLPGLRLSHLSPRSGEYEAEENVALDGNGWYTLLSPRDTVAQDDVVVRLEWSPAGNDTTSANADKAAWWISLRVLSYGVLSPQRQEADDLRIGAPLLCSAAAHTVSPEDAMQLCTAIQHRIGSAEHVKHLKGDARLSLGEPVVTALYQDGAETLPDCYDYVFVTAFTGATVQDVSRLTLADFDAEAATPHLPLSCNVALPWAVR